jgi:hypothetical protein
MIRAVVTDLDQTLLRTDKSVSDYTVGVLACCRKRGIKVIYATARSTQAAVDYTARFTPDVFIGYGGALVTEGDKVIHRIGIDADTSRRLIGALDAMDVKPYIYAVNEKTAVFNKKDFYDNEDRHYKYSDFTVIDPDGFLKISPRSDYPERIREIAEDFPELDMIQYTGEYLYRFAHRDALKHNALAKTLEYLGIGAGETAAFGDDINDTEMVRMCGFGVAVANAVDEVKAAARYICGSNDEDGVARWIEGNVLI